MFSLADFRKLHRRPAIMGIVNATGDSFSEGDASAPASAVDRALTLLDDGADVLDLGGESTRPGARPVAPQEEISRVIPVIKELKKLHRDVIISVDTRNYATAQTALDAGAEMINDVSMLRNAPEIADLTARYPAVLILNHSRALPENMSDSDNCVYPSGVAHGVKIELAHAVQNALQRGMKSENIILDPGFGFAKTPEQCWTLVRELDAVAPLPEMLAGVSRKRFLGEITGETNAACRSAETLTLEILLAQRGIGMLRTHRVKALKNALLILEKTGELKS